MKHLGFFSICALGINIIIGSAIFLLPHSINLYLGSYSILILFIVSLLAMGVGLMYAEMAGKYKEDGASYIYVKDNFGPYLGFLVAFTRFVAGFMLWAALATGFSESLKTFFPVLEMRGYQISVSITLTIVLALLTLRGLNGSRLLNNFFTITKLSPILLFLIAGVFMMNTGNIAILPDFNAPLPATFSLTSGILLVFFAFGGIEDIAMLASQMKNPKKNAPKAVLSVLLFVAILLILIPIIAQGVLDPNIESTNPIRDSLEKMFGRTGYYIASLGMVVAMLGSNISISILYGRRMVALVESGALPQKLGHLNKNGVPVYSILITMAMSCVLIFINNFAILAETVMTTLLFQYVLVMFAVLKSRKRNIEGSIKVPFAHLIIMICVGFSIYLLFTMNLVQLFFGLLIWIIIGTILYLFIPKNRKIS